VNDTEFETWFAGEVAALPGVEAVALGGSRSRGEHRPDSDWDFALYYRGTFDPDSVRARGWDGEISDLGGWGGGVMNGGGWLRVDGRPVDLHYRDLDEVTHWWDEARAGRFEKQLLMFYLAGIPTYAIVGELGINRVLAGALPRPEFPAALRESAARRWHDDALLSISYRPADDPVVTIGNTTRALIEEAHSRLAAQGVWATNEKRMIARAGLDHVAETLRTGGSVPEYLDAAASVISAG
jgi:predicted nucleotidyltransferase